MASSANEPLPWTQFWILSCRAHPTTLWLSLFTVVIGMELAMFSLPKPPTFPNVDQTQTAYALHIILWTFVAIPLLRRIQR
jgi:hypothetical protein